jgi:hypothetical protein
MSPGLQRRVWRLAGYNRAAKVSIQSRVTLQGTLFFHFITQQRMLRSLEQAKKSKLLLEGKHMAQDSVCGMQVDEKTGLRLSYSGTDYYFCNPRCMEKFARDYDIPEQQLADARAGHHKKHWYTNKTIIISGALLILVLASYPIPLLAPFRSRLMMYVSTLWWAVLLGLGIGGLIDHFIPREYISHILARPLKRTIPYAVVTGFLMSTCSHGILALSIQLHKKGAANAAVVAFLLASPWANMPLTILLIGFFGLKAFYIIGAAILIAVITGFIYQVLERAGVIEQNPNSVQVGKEFSIVADIKQRYRVYCFSMDRLHKDLSGIWSGAVSLGNMVLWWILIGMGLAALAGAYIPSDFFMNYMGPTLMGLIITLAFATVIEVCSEGSAPIAFEIFKQTGAVGNSFVFLMAGVVTDYTEIGLLWSNVGKKTAVFLPIAAVPQVLILGYIANKIL